MDSSSTVPHRHVANEAQVVLSWHDEDIRSDVSLCPATPATFLLSLRTGVDQELNSTALCTTT